MSDIFISYASEDRETAQSLAHVLEAKQWSVWWDPKILPGKIFDEAIHKALNEARCVVVLWSKESIGSRWVRTEAGEAANAKKLVPALIEEVDIPLAFKRIQTASLVDWHGEPDHPELIKVLNGIAGILGQEPRFSSTTGPSKKFLSRKMWTLILLLLPSLLAALVLWVLMGWKIPTHVQIKLATTHATLHIGSTVPSTQILNAVPFNSIGFEKFSSFSLYPEQVEVADPQQFDLSKGQYSVGAWKRVSLPPEGRVQFSGNTKGLSPSVRIGDPRQTGKAGGLLDRVVVASQSTVKINVRGPQSEKLTLKISGKKREDNPEVLVRLSGPFSLNVVHSRSLELADNPFPEAQALTYRITLQEDSPTVVVGGLQQELVLNLDLLKQQEANVFSTQPISVTGLTFTTIGDAVGANKLVSTLIGQGEISYPDYPHIDVRTFHQPDFIALEAVDLFLIQSIRIDSSQPGIHFLVDGVASKVRTGVKTDKQGYATDHRLSRFDTLRHSLGLGATLTVLLWLFPTTLGVFRLFRKGK